MRCLRLAVLFGFVLAIVGCSEPSVEVRTDSSSESVVVTHGPGYELSAENRGALGVIFDGKLEDGRFGVEVAQVFDADIYVGPDDEAGDPHWITRARVLDEDGEPLWTQRINSHYQVLEFLSPVLDEFTPPSLNFDIEIVYELAKEDYPELLQFPVKVPNEIEGADRYVLEVEMDGERGNWRRVADYSIAELEQQAVEPNPAFDYEVETMVEHGSGQDSINVAILGDGYTEEERQKFNKDAEAVKEAFLESSPIKEHADLFNIRRVWTPSNESGAGYDCNHGDAADDCEQDFRDTPFETTFVIPALGDEYGYPTDGISDRVALPLNIAGIYETAALTGYDEVILISNSDKMSGFAGLYVAVVTNYDDRQRFPHTAVHEVGHTLGLLGDEYYNSGDACYYNEPTIPLPANIETVDRAVDDNEALKWEEWLSQDVPLPTPSFGNFGDRYEVGAFDPAYNCDDLVRPSAECKMNSSTDEFCPICAEQMVRRFYSVVSPAHSGGLSIDVTAGSDVTITAPVREDAASDRYEVTWTVDGEPLDTTSEALQLDRDQLDDQQWTEVSITIRNTSEFVKTYDHVVESTFDLQVRLPG